MKEQSTFTFYHAFKCRNRTRGTNIIFNGIFCAEKAPITATCTAHDNMMQHGSTWLTTSRWYLRFRGPPVTAIINDSMVRSLNCLEVAPQSGGFLNRQVAEIRSARWFVAANHQMREYLFDKHQQVQHLLALSQKAPFFWCFHRGCLTKGEGAMRLKWYEMLRNGWKWKPNWNQLKSWVKDSPLGVLLEALSRRLDSKDWDLLATWDVGELENKGTKGPLFEEEIPDLESIFRFTR